MANLFQEAHDRFDENLQSLLNTEQRNTLTDKQQFETVMWNLSVGLRNLTEALKSEHESIRSALEEIKRDQQRRG